MDTDGQRLLIRAHPFNNDFSTNFVVLQVFVGRGF
jgi:hypothetical protein